MGREMGICSVNGVVCGRAGETDAVEVRSAAVHLGILR